MNERTLDKIRIKVRRFTARLSPERIEDIELDEFIFEAMRYDLPEDLGFGKIETDFQLLTIANVGTYDLTTMKAPDRDINLYEVIFPPARIGSTCLTWVRSYGEFCKDNLRSEKQVVKGAGVGPYDIALKNPVVPGSVYLLLDDLQIYLDRSINGLLGTFINQKTGAAINAEINYVIGKVSATFSQDVPSITLCYKTYLAAKPTQLYFDGKVIHLSPIPDDNYVITCRAYKNPLRLLLESDSPEVDKWSDYIALAASRRIFRESDNFDAMLRYEIEMRREMANNIYRHNTQLGAKKLNSRNLYSGGNCDCCSWDPCAFSKNIFIKG